MNGVYYNEIDPYAAQWLRNLIAAGHIAPGDVDERSIVDVRADDIRGYTQCHFFAGIGVWSLALRLVGWPDDEAVWTGSCPCQPFSAAGRLEQFGDDRHLWPELFRLVRERRPHVVFGEQVARKNGLAWLDVVQNDMESIGYAIGATNLCAAGFGAPHIRQRLWFVAESDQRRRRQDREHGMGASMGARFEGSQTTATVADASPANGFWGNAEWIECADGRLRAVEPGTRPLAHGSPSGDRRLRAYGNAIVAPVAEEFIRAYRELRT